MNTDAINEAAEKYANDKTFKDTAKYGFAKGALSDAAKEYWYEQFKSGMKDVKKLPEVEQLDQVINTYVHAHGSGTYKHIQERFWVAIDAIDKVYYIPQKQLTNEEIQSLAENEYPDNMGGIEQRGVNRYRAGFIKGYKAAINKTI